MPESAEAAAVSGSAIADFDARFELARGRLLRIAISLVGDTEAEDVVQDAYVAARRRLPQLRDPDTSPRISSAAVSADIRETL